VDEKITLIDTVKKEFAHELLTSISQIVDPKKIDYVISNHTEMDHSGGLARVMHQIGEDKPLFCSKMGERNLALHFPKKWDYRPVEDGGELNIGKRTLTFFETRMLHWPDSMFTYSKDEKILFSSDAFGQHYAGHERFDDEIGDMIMLHAKKYYANILLLYAPLILKLIAKVAKMALPVEMICPDHGIMWRKDPGRIISAYGKWSEQAPTRKAVIVYDTMWHSTQTMAESIADGLIEQNVDTKVMCLKNFHRSDIMTEVLDAGAVLVGSPTLNNGLFPTIADFLSYMGGLKPKNKVAAGFGSYGWSGESVKLIQDALDKMGFKTVDQGLKVQYVPDKNALESCRVLGRKVADLLPSLEN